MRGGTLGGDAVAAMLCQIKAIGDHAADRSSAFNIDELYALRVALEVASDRVNERLSQHFIDGAA
jgi:hypothetical protein